MAFEISEKDGCVRLEFFDGFDYWEILEAIGRLMAWPGSAHKNDIWIFRAGRINITYDDLFKIKEIIDEHYPEDATAPCSAVVVADGLQASLADMYRDIEKRFPRKIKIFTHLSAAEKWLAGCGSDQGNRME